MCWWTFPMRGLTPESDISKSPFVLPRAASETRRQRHRLGSRWLSHWLLVAKRQPLGVVSAVILLALILSAAGAEVLAPYDPLTVADAARLQSPSWSHPLG